MTEAFAPDAATRAQIGAADPSGSVWLGANAGSGKTRVLTNRVAWLLLEGAAPERILCLTFTRAAAAEMQNRLSETLGRWAMLADDDLRRALVELGVPRGRISTERLQRARTLFARAIETPGGLKIQTIHAFCSGLLRRFPLEAGVTPAFHETDDVTAKRLLVDVLDAMADDPQDAPLVEGVARLLSASAPEEFLTEIARKRDLLANPAEESALRATLGVEGESRTEVIGWGIDSDALDTVERVRDAAKTQSATTMVKLADQLSQAMLADEATRFAMVCKALLTKDGVPRKNPLTKPALAAFGEYAQGEIEALAEKLMATQEALKAHDALDRARVLHAFAPRFLSRMAGEKARRGWLDYDDLVLRARALLTHRDTAQWVLWKLDGGIDHVLVDEAQDTNQVQWDVIAALTAEFGAGEGAREGTRTLFVVGDGKQSIFSFQGADPAAYHGMRDRLGEALAGGAALRDHALRHSFRSAPVLLSLVDRVFEAPSGAGDPTDHVAFNADMPGRVDLLDHIPEPERPEKRVWYDPVDHPAENAAHIVLARKIAATIREALQAGTPIMHKGTRRALEPRDVLILFRSRDKLFDATIVACKAAGLPMAGADRLRLTSELAVKDLLALCRFAATPEDDLSLAGVLRSPLGGVSEAQLYSVAADRDTSRPLWRAVSDADLPVMAMLDDVMKQADFLRPFELLQRILTRHDGRRLLLGRLGDAAAEAIDGLLQQALAYEALAVPSLTGFLSWIDEAEIEIKREATAGAIRVMSIHGAKGLEAPLVILPQCGPWKPKEPDAILLPDGETPVWRGRKSDAGGPLLAAYDAAQTRMAEERDRLLYVALTRAESWLICASAGTEEKEPGTSWAGRVRAALEGLGAERDGDRLRLETGDWSMVPRDTAPVTTPRPLDLDAITAPPPAAALLSPSDLGGAKALPGEISDGAKDHGSRVHLLLEHLPDLPEAEWDAAARSLLTRAAPVPTAEETARAVQEAIAVQRAFPQLFAPDTLAEMPFVLPATDGAPGLSGTMDRVVVTSDTVQIVDFKTNQRVPARQEDIPEGVLRQLGAYAHAARHLWPDHKIETAVLWTASLELMTVSQETVNAAFRRLEAH